MFPEPTELLLIGCLIELIWTQKTKSSTFTPKTNSQTYWPREISHVMSGIIFLCLLNLAISVLQIVLKWCRKERKKIQVKKKSHSKVEADDDFFSRCSERTPDVLASTASERPRKTRYESHLPLSSWNDKHLRTGRLVKDAYSSSYSEWNADKNWSFQEWKSDELIDGSKNGETC